MNAALQKQDIGIIIVDDDEDIRINTVDLLATKFKNITAYKSVHEVFAKLQLHAPVVVLTDLRMPDGDGLEFAQKLANLDKDIPVILMTGYGDVSTAVDAMKQGVHDFIEKPFDTDHLIQTIERAIEKRLLTLSLLATQQTLAHIQSIDTKLIGQCPAMRHLKQQIVEFANMDIPITIYGETGVGKELVARSLHELGQRATKNFVALNCAAIPENLAEAELFGHEKGAFTDAATARMGKLQYADGGTLFLDEVESLPLTTQAKLLRAISDNKISPLGSNKEIPIDCRIISATKVELRNNEDFRQDLFFRLQVAELRVPSLQQRGEDILILFENFVQQQCKNFNRKYTMANSTTRQILLQYAWPGNVRELLNVATRYAIQGCQDIQAAIEIDNFTTSTDSLKSMVQAYEEKLIRAKLLAYRGKVSAVLDDLNLERRTFNQKLKRYGINTNEYRS